MIPPGKVFRQCENGDRIATCYHAPRCSLSIVPGQFGRLVSTLPELPQGWLALPVSHVCPPCPECLEPPRMDSAGTAVLRHRPGCPVHLVDRIIDRLHTYSPQARGPGALDLVADLNSTGQAVTPAVVRAALTQMEADGLAFRHRNVGGPWRWTLTRVGKRTS